MRLRSRRQANCNFPLLLQCLSYTIAHSQTREHAYVLTCKHTPTQMHPCCVCMYASSVSLSVSQETWCFSALFLLFIALQSEIRAILPSTWPSYTFILCTLLRLKDTDAIFFEVQLKWKLSFDPFQPHPWSYCASMVAEKNYKKHIYSYFHTKVVTNVSLCWQQLVLTDVNQKTWLLPRNFFCIK